MKSSGGHYYSTIGNWLGSTIVEETNDLEETNIFVKKIIIVKNIIANIVNRLFRLVLQDK